LCGAFGGNHRAAIVTQLLLIEDDARIRRVVEVGLGSRGFTVCSAPDGATAIELLRTARLHGLRTRERQDEGVRLPEGGLPVRLELKTR
jgi:CheY-like chemotaxis protein